MGQKKYKNIIIGIILLIVAGACVFAAINLKQHSISPSTQSLPAKKSSIEQDSNVVDIRKKSVEQVTVTERKADKTDSIDLSVLVSDAESLYGAEEVSRKEGLMWIDREESRFVVTLGAVNGLKHGSRLSVYDGDVVIAKVSVETLLDIISYVNPIGNDKDQLKDNYYKVIMDSQ